MPDLLHVWRAQCIQGDCFLEESVWIIIGRKACLGWATSLARSPYQGWSSCAGSRSVEHLMRLARCCQSLWTGQVFSLCTFSAPHRKPDRGRAGISQYQECGTRMHLAGRLDFWRPRMTFLARPFCRRSHPHALKRCQTLLPLVFHARSHPRCSTHGKMSPGSLRKGPPLPDSEGFPAFSPPTRKKKP